MRRSSYLNFFKGMNTHSHNNNTNNDSNNSNLPNNNNKNRQIILNIISIIIIVGSTYLFFSKLPLNQLPFVIFSFIFSFIIFHNIMKYSIIYRICWSTTIN